MITSANIVNCAFAMTLTKDLIFKVGTYTYWDLAQTQYMKKRKTTQRKTDERKQSIKSSIQHDPITNHLDRKEIIPK